MAQWTVEHNDSGKKLITFLSEQLIGQYSSRYLKKIIENNGCKINGRVERFASCLIGKGDIILIDLPNTNLKRHLSYEPARLLFEDESILVYDKPAGIACDEKGILTFWKATAPSLKLVHRLDQGTSGALILAKNETVLKNLISQFKQFLVEKSYLTIVDGIPAKTQGKIENFLEKKMSYQGQSIWGSASKGQYACTEWRLLKKGKDACLIECFPKTGRTHQLRVHLSEMGHPILGDYHYGKNFTCTFQAKRTLLYAHTIAFFHPINGKKMKFSAPIPQDFMEAQKELL